MTSRAFRGRAAGAKRSISATPWLLFAQAAGTYLGAGGQDPHDRPKRSKRSPAPFFHAVSARVRDELWEGYRWFVAAFRDAAEKLRAGDRNVSFPAGSFPPALPFVGG